MTVRACVRRQPEAVQQEQGIALLRSLGATVYRLGVRRRRTDHQGTMQTPGLPDVIAFVPVRGTVPSVHRFLAWEAKAARGRLRPAQVEFQDLCATAAVAHVVGDLTALMRWLVAEGWLRAEQLTASRTENIC